MRSEPTPARLGLGDSDDFRRWLAATQRAVLDQEPAAAIRAQCCTNQRCECHTNMPAKIAAISPKNPPSLDVRLKLGRRLKYEQ